MFRGQRLLADVSGCGDYPVGRDAIRGRFCVYGLFYLFALFRNVNLWQDYYKGQKANKKQGGYPGCYFCKPGERGDGVSALCATSAILS